MHSPKSKGEELKGTDTRPTFRFAPHTDRIVPDSAPSTASDAGREPALSPKLNIHPVIPVRTDSISHETGSTGTVDQTSSATHAKKTLKPVLTVRTLDDNQERAHGAASHRSGRPVEARIDPGRKASASHEIRIGLGLRVTSPDGFNKGRHAEEGDNSRGTLSPSGRRRTRSVGCSACHPTYSSSLPVRKDPNARHKPAAHVSSIHTFNSSRESSGRFTPDSVHEPAIMEDSADQLPSAKEVDEHLHEESSRGRHDGNKHSGEDIGKEHRHGENCDCFDHTKTMIADGNDGISMMEDFMKKMSYNDKLSMMLGDAATMLHDLCINDHPSVFHGRRLIQHIQWLTRDLEKDLGKDKMEKIRGDEGNVVPKVVISPQPERVEETNLEKQDRLMNEIRIMRLEETRERLKHWRERANSHKRSESGATEMEQHRQEEEKLLRDLGTDRTKLCDKALKLMIDGIEEEQIHLEAGDPKHEIYFKVSVRKDNVELERVTVEGMVKRLLETPKAKKMKADAERQQQFDDEIDRLQKEKAVKELNDEVGRVRMVELMTLEAVKRFENELAWAGLEKVWGLALTAGGLILGSFLLFTALLFVSERILAAWGRLIVCLT